MHSYMYELDAKVSIFEIHVLDCGLLGDLTLFT